MDKCILFGAGNHGKSILDFLKNEGIDNYVYGFCDTDNNKVGKAINGKPIITYEAAKAKNLPIVLSVISKTAHNEIVEMLDSDNIIYYKDIFFWLNICQHVNSTELNRKYCAYSHMSDMDVYFEDAETEGALNLFWDKSSPFYVEFKRLDLSNVIELACGRGRHVEKYYNDAKKITLVDVLDKNISICKDRYKDYSNISYYVNNGHDLSELNDNTYSALFTYDAMVHFEMFDIYDYLKETYRVLIRGGKALFHHSNLALAYDQSFENSYNPGSRNFMSKDIFAYLAYKAGFEIISQKVIDWSLPEMDCITLVQKH